jgi:hypothetical protein
MATLLLGCYAGAATIITQSKIQNRFNRILVTKEIITVNLLLQQIGQLHYFTGVMVGF